MTQITNPLGRMKVNNPEFQYDVSDGGTNLYNVVTALFKTFSDNYLVKFVESTTLANAALTTVTHRFNMPATQLQVFIIESGVIVGEAARKLYTVAQVDNNEITITNNSGGSKTFEAYVFGFNFNDIFSRYPAVAQTTNATVATLMSRAIPLNTTEFLTAKITARQSGTINAIFELKYRAVNNAGTTTVVLLEKTVFKDTASWDAIIDGSGADARVRITGQAATTIAWACVLTSTNV